MPFSSSLSTPLTPPINNTTFFFSPSTHHLYLSIMAKLIIILLAALFLASTMAEASIYRTTTVTTTYETDSSTEDVSSKCKQEMQQYSLNSCRDLMRKFMPPGMTTMLMSVADGKEQEPPKECCSELSNVSKECRCDLVRQMMLDVKLQSHRGWERQMPKEMVRCGERLTQSCDLSPHSCTITQ